MEEWREKVENDEVPEVVKEEPNDKPAAKTLNWTILITVVLLTIIYFVFFY